MIKHKFYLGYYIFHFIYATELLNKLSFRNSKDKRVSKFKSHKKLYVELAQIVKIIHGTKLYKNFSQELLNDMHINISLIKGTNQYHKMKILGD